MSTPLYYPIADKTTQNFVKKYPGKAIKPGVLIIHTMEVNGFPGYGNGNSAPHLSLKLSLDGDGNLLGYKWRQHFPFTRTARALRNNKGGVETNNSAQGVIQIELGGTCGWAPKVKPNWADPVQLAKIAEPLVDFIVWAHKELGIELEVPYDFYAWNKSGKRMTFKQWLNFKGIAGHQHVPENTHVDPGKIDIDYILSLVKAKLDGEVTDPVTPAPVDPVVAPVPIPNTLKITKKFDKATIKALQWVLKVSIDGIWDSKTKKALQKWLFVKQDLVIGPKTVKALQKRVGLKGRQVDGKWYSQTNEYLQKYLNRRISNGNV